MAGIGRIRHQLLDQWQRDFPLSPTPFADIAEALGVGEEEVLAHARELIAEGTISRIGAVVRPNTVGASTLAAVAAPADEAERIARAISARPEVNHCYLREHAYNIWFVVTAADRAGVAACLTAVAAGTGLDVLDLPLLEPFHIDLGFALP